MLRPSYTELMEILNNASDVDSNKITSRYTIVIAASKRARQLINGADPLTYAPSDRAVSTAVKEMQEGMINIKFSGEADFSVMNGGLAYTNYEGSYGEEAFQNTKPIDYTMEQSDREARMLSEDDGGSLLADDYDTNDDNMDYEDHNDDDYVEHDLDMDTDQDYQDGEQ